MALTVHQFRYFGDNASESSKNTATANKFADGTVFQPYGSIYQLGVQALPGTKFFLNGAVDPIIIGSTGIFELELKGDSAITSLTFAPSSLVAIHESPNSYLIVDVVCDGKSVVGG